MGHLTSCLVYPSGTHVMADGRVKVRGFFNNEWDLAHRLRDLARLMGLRRLSPRVERHQCPRHERHSSARSSAVRCARSMVADTRPVHC